MNILQYLDRLKEMDPDILVDELGLTSEEIVKKFKNKAKAKFYSEEAEEEDESEDN